MMYFLCRVLAFLMIVSIPIARSENTDPSPSIARDSIMKFEAQFKGHDPFVSVEVADVIVGKKMANPFETYWRVKARVIFSCANGEKRMAKALYKLREDGFGGFDVGLEGPLPAGTRCEPT